MKKNLFIKYLIAALLPVMVFTACSSSESTIVIEDAPTSSDSTPATDNKSELSGAFRQLTIGENEPIRTLDPLFIENGSSMRAVQLVYEGLVRFDEKGEITPALARTWSTNDNQTTYRFTLKSDVFYHDNNIFSNGRGRRVVAADVKKVFERMTNANVPDRAANLFMNIRGFEPYFNEQHEAILDAERQLDGITGIQTPNDSTVVFSLVEPDGSFYKKLASPYGVIYPQEAVNAPNFKAVGTGPFIFSQKRSDSLYIFAAFEDYHVNGQPKINRVDIRTSHSEVSLLNALSRGDIQLLPELGPRQMQMALQADGQLNTRMQADYQVYDSKGEIPYFLRYNPNADKSKNAVVSAFRLIEETKFFPDLPTNSVEVRSSLPASNATTAADSLASTYSENPLVQNFYNQLSQRFQESNVTFIMKQTRIPNRNIPLYIDRYPQFQDVQMQTPPENTLVSILLKSTAIAHRDIQQLQFNTFPWWINFRQVTLPSTDAR